LGLQLPLRESSPFILGHSKLHGSHTMLVFSEQRSCRSRACVASHRPSFTNNFIDDATDGAVVVAELHAAAARQIVRADRTKEEYALGFAGIGT
jgi:hypothetical protein